MNVVDLSKKLISINSENPPGNEKDIGNFIKYYLKDNGFTVKSQKVSKNRRNIIAYSSKPKNSIVMFSGHMDVVPIGDRKKWKYNPYGEIVRGKLYGRGACDMKSALAAMISAGIEAKKEKLKKGFSLMFTVDEEYGFSGIDTLLEYKNKLIPNVKYVVIGEPSDLKLISSHRGVATFKITFFGKEGHESKESEKDNPILMANEFINTIQKTFPKAKDKLLGNQSITFYSINTNTEIKVCEMEITFWVVRPYNAKKLENYMKEIIKRKKLNAKIETLVDSPYFITKKNSPIVSTAKKVMKSMNLDTKTYNAPYYSEGGKYQRIGRIDPIILGVGKIEHAHQPNEFIKIKDLEKLREIYKNVIVSFCK